MWAVWLCVCVWKAQTNLLETCSQFSDKQRREKVQTAQVTDWLASTKTPGSGAHRPQVVRYLGT